MSAPPKKDPRALPSDAEPDLTEAAIPKSAEPEGSTVDAPSSDAPSSEARSEAAGPALSDAAEVATNELEEPVVEAAESDAPEPAAGSVRPGLKIEAHTAFLAILAFVVGVLLWPHTEDTSAPMGEVRDSSGIEVPMEGLMTPVTLVHFWSTWCPPCITETPAIQRLAQDFAQDQRFSLLMVAVADDETKVGEFLGSVEATFYDPDWDVAKSYGTDKLPETHLVVQGQLVESFIGATDWDDPKIRRRISAALEQAAAQTAAARSS